MRPMTRSTTHFPSRVDRREALCIFAVACVVYLIFRSRFYIGDGVRYLQAALGASLPGDGGNSHFLWPFVLWIAVRGFSALGMVPAGDGLANLDVVALLQAVNAVAAALGLALLYLWLRRVASRRAALIAVALTGLSHAFILHATDMTEPMAAVPPVMLGLGLLGAAPDRTWARLGAGALIGLGGNFYQIALFAAVPAVWLAATPNGPGGIAQRLLRLARAGLEIGGASVVTFVGLIVVVRFAATPGADLIHQVAQVRTVATAGGLAGSFSPKHFAAWIFGFANAFAVLPPNEGIGRLLHSPPRDLLKALTILALAMAFLVGLVARLVRSRQILIQRNLGPEIQAAAAWFFLVVFMVCVWSVLYEKFWLFAMLPLSMVVALAIDPEGEPEPAAPTPVDAGARRRLLFVAPAVALVVWNFFGAVIPRRFAANPDVRGAVLLAGRLQATDLLVCPGWDAVSVYTRTFFRHPAESFSITDEAVAHGPEVADRLSAAVAAAEARGGHVYMLVLPGMSRDDWDLFYGSRLKVPFTVLDPYRPAALPIEVLPAAIPEPLYELMSLRR